VRHFLTLLILFYCLSVVGCKARNTVNDTELATATRATNNVQAVANTLGNIPGMVPYSDILKDQVRVWFSALALQAQDLKELSDKFQLDSNLSAQGLAVNPAAEAEKSKAQADKDVEDNDESQVGTWAWIATAGGVALWVARLLNVPGVQIMTDPVIKAAFGFVTKPLEQKAAEFEQKTKNLALTVESSMVGRAGLATLDQKLAHIPQINDYIKTATQGKASTIEQLFTYVAHANAIDSKTGSHEGVRQVLAIIKNEMDTEGKVPTAIHRIMDTSVEADRGVA